MMFEIITFIIFGLFGIAFSIKLITTTWKFIYGLAPIVVPFCILMALYFLYVPML